VIGPDDGDEAGSAGLVPFPDFYSFADLWHQYRACRSNKRNTVNALAFELDAETNLLELQRELRDHSYRPGPSICFITDGPKPREVFAADFRDRVVHHLLVAAQERVFERRFIHDSYACRVGKGTLAASNRLMQFLRGVTANGRRGAWALKLDVADYFPSIHKRTLYETIARAVRDPELLWLTRVLLLHDPTADYHFRSRRGRTAAPGDEQYPVPKRKSLFGKENLRGLPIGNLTSQFWGNVYLDQVDQLVKRTLRCRYYLRYVDDMVLLGPDADELLCWRAAIAGFLREQLGLELKPGQRELIPVRDGIDYVGWKTWWNRRLPRRQTPGRLRSRLDRFERRLAKPAFGKLAQRIDLGAHTGPRTIVDRSRSRDSRTSDVERLRATVASYSGHLRHGDAWHEWTRTWQRFPWLHGLFECDGWDVLRRWPHDVGRLPQRFGDQYGRVIRRAAHDHLVFWPVGRFIEFYGPQRLLAERLLGLRRARLARGNYAFTAGFPFWLAPRFAQRALRAGVGIIIVSQEAQPESGTRLWSPAALLVPRGDRAS
jgi:RNA-directed DNA polymerase